MTIDITNGKTTREIHFSPIFKDTFIWIRRKMGYVIIEQNDEIIDICVDGEYVDDVIARIKEFNPILIIR